VARAHPLVYASLLGVVVVWGGSFVAARLLLSAQTAGQATLSPTVLAATRFGIAACFFIPALARAAARGQVVLGDALQMAVLGQVTYTVYFWLQYTGVQQTGAGIASILVVGLIPAATTVVSRLLGGERLRLVTLGALLVGFLGVACIVIPQGVHIARQAGFLFGAICLVADAFAFALYSALGKRWMRRTSPLVMTGGTMLSGALGLALLSLTDPARNRWSALARLDSTQWIALLYLALVCSVAAYFAYNHALTWVPASRAAVYVYVEPVVAVALGALLLGERLSGQVVVGATLIGLSVAFVHLLGRQQVARIRVRADVVGR
jgi:drug/metabolite transporter (DMT)-like permease